MLHDTFCQDHRFWHHNGLIEFVAWFDNAGQRRKNESIKGEKWHRLISRAREIKW